MINCLIKDNRDQRHQIVNVKVKPVFTKTSIKYKRVQIVCFLAGDFLASLNRHTGTILVGFSVLDPQNSPTCPQGV